MMLIKSDDVYYIVDASGNQVVKFEKDSFGTHGHWKGYLTYRKTDAGDWMWTGVDRRIVKVTFTDPEYFRNLKEIKSYYSIA